MTKTYQGICQCFRRMWRCQSGITGLETAIVLIAFVVVGSVFAFTVIKTGLFSSERAQETAQAGLGEAKSSMIPKGSVVLEDNAPVDGDVDLIKFKLTLGAGSEPIGLADADTVVTYLDQNNNFIATSGTTGSSTPVGWNAVWLAGSSGPSLDAGEVVEFTIDTTSLPLAAGATALGTNTRFNVQIIPREGGVVSVSRTTPLELTKIMDMN